MRLFISILVFQAVICYLPVVFIHGYKGTFNDWDYYLRFIEAKHPGTKCYPIHFFPGESSEKTNLLEQTTFVVSEIEKIQTQNNISRFILVAHSQGGLIARSAAEIIGGDQIDTFISLSGVQAGYFGGGCGKMKYPKILEDFTFHEASKIVYTKYFQEHYSFGNFWNDPKSRKLYLKECKYMTLFNNETYNPLSEQYKSNFKKIRKAVFFGGPDDECIKPWESALFGYYANDDMSKMLGMKEREVYIKDSFGLKTMDEEGRLFLNSVPGYKHIDWIENEEFFKNHILELLV